MENPTYAALTRQSGLAQELRAIANNIANASTTGFKAEGVMFSEFIAGLGQTHPSLSMAASRVRQTDFAQAALQQTGGPFDLAIEGDGFFLIETPAGERLTRAGSFTPNADGDLVTMDGLRVLDAGGAPVFVPPGVGPVGISTDGTISANGAPIGQIGLVQPINMRDLTREGGTLFNPNGPIEPAEAAMLQGFLEASNVNPIAQISRMIEVQRAYELSQSFVEQEHERIRNVLQASVR